MIAAYLPAAPGSAASPSRPKVDTLAVILVGSSHLPAAGSERAPVEPDDLRRVLSTAVESIVGQQPTSAAQT